VAPSSPQIAVNPNPQSNLPRKWAFLRVPKKFFPKVKKGKFLPKKVLPNSLIIITLPFQNPRSSCGI